MKERSLRPDQFISVVNFEKFQHYHDRKPPWIKLYRDLLHDDRLFDLTEAERWHLVGLFILASQHDNRVPFKPAWLKKELALSKPISLKKLIETGWVILLEQDASNPLAASKEIAPSDHDASDTLSLRARSREQETEKETYKTETYIPQTPLVAYGEFQRAKMTVEQHEKLEAKLNGDLDSYIQRYDRWVNEAPEAKANGVRRKDRHAYESILNWSDRDRRDAGLDTQHSIGFVGPQRPSGIHRCELCQDPHDWNCADEFCASSHRYTWPCQKALTEKRK